MKTTAIVLGSCTYAIFASKLVINEVSDAGANSACDSADWIELLNVPTGDDSTIDLGGFMLCDDNGCSDSKAYTFPSGSTIDSGEYKVLCKGSDGFAFGIGGDDTVTLQNQNGEILDVAGAMPDTGGFDITWSRLPDGTGDFKYTAEATPGAPNVDREIPQVLDCASSYSTLRTGDTCVITWDDLSTGDHRLLPTETSVGHAWVIRQMYDDFETEADATKYLGKHEFPVVMYNGQFYLTDRHHHMVALQLSGHADKMSLVLKVVCDYSAVPADDFWSEMVASNYALAYDWSDAEPEALPSLVDFGKMPTSWEMNAFGDNPWRGLAGFASSDKWEGWTEEERCYVQTCDYFVDFGWAYLFTEAATGASNKWPAEANLTSQEFLEMLRALPRHPSVEDYDAAAWHTLAGELLPLCHSAAVENYPLPEFFPNGHLNGWSAVPLPSDPDCLPGLCGGTAVVV